MAGDEERGVDRRLTAKLRAKSVELARDLDHSDVELGRLGRADVPAAALEDDVVVCDLDVPAHRAHERPQPERVDELQVDAANVRACLGPLDARRLAGRHGRELDGRVHDLRPLLVEDLNPSARQRAVRDRHDASRRQVHARTVKPHLERIERGDLKVELHRDRRSARAARQHGVPLRQARRRLEGERMLPPARQISRPQHGLLLARGQRQAHVRHVRLRKQHDLAGLAPLDDTGRLVAPRRRGGGGCGLALRLLLGVSGGEGQRERESGVSHGVTQSKES